MLQTRLIDRSRIEEDKSNMAIKLISTLEAHPEEPVMYHQHIPS